MDAISKLKSINLSEHISKYLGNPKNETDWFRFHSSPEDTTPSLLVYKNQAKWYNDFSWRLGWWTIIDFHMNYFNLELNEAIKQLCEMYSITDETKKEFKPAPKRYLLVEEFYKYRLQESNLWFSKFLTNRWFSFEQLTEYKEQINKVAKEVWFCEWQYVDDNTYKDVIIFPCYDQNNKIVWWKLRRVDWEKIKTQNWYIKSVTISKPKDYQGEQIFSTWLLYKEILTDHVLIVEWETDYLILKILGFKSVIWNLWWVSSNAKEIQQLVKNVEKVICLYDNDSAWIKWAIDLQIKIGKPIRVLNYPKIDWLDKYDINDLFKMWYRREEFEKLINNSTLIQETQIIESQEKQKLFNDRYFYDDTQSKYFDFKSFLFKNPADLARHLFLKPKDLEELRNKWDMPVYEWVCYLDWWKKWYFNLLDKSQMLKPSKTPWIHEDIQLLLKNICNNNKENLEWLLKAILYKYTHLNDVYIPAVVFHWVWWTWKWLFIKLLSQIFWENNTQIWLTQDNIDSRFSGFTWQKLIVEFKEVNVENTAKGKKNMDKLKTFIMEDRIMIEKKWQDPIWIDNIAWFILSSNHTRPIYLDSSDSWNRRFTIIKTWWVIWIDKGKEIAKTISDKKNVEDFLAFLFEKFPEITTSTKIDVLNNQDKRDLEFACESVWNLFFKWFEEKYPHINKITNHERDILLDNYRTEIWELDYRDERYTINYFNSWLSHKYQILNWVIRWKKIRWYKIDKKVEWTGEFEEWYFEVEKTRIDWMPFINN